MVNAALPVRRLVLSVVLLIIIFAVFPPRALGNHGPEFDRAYSQWTVLFKERKFDEVIADIERLVAAGTGDYPEAYRVWMDVHVVKGDLRPALANAPAKIKQYAVFIHNADSLDVNDDYYGLYKAYLAFRDKDGLDNGTLENVAFGVADINVDTVYKNLVAAGTTYGFESQLLRSLLALPRKCVEGRIDSQLLCTPSRLNRGAYRLLSDLLHLRGDKPYDNLAAWEAYCNANPDDRFAPRMIGKCFQELEKYDSAIFYYRKHFDGNPFESYDLDDIAYCHGKMQRYQEMRRTLAEKESLFFRNDSLLHFYKDLVRCLRLIGNYGKFEEENGRALTLFPENAYFLYYATLINEALSAEEKGKKYVTYFEKFRQNDTGDFFYLNRLIASCLDSRQYEKAFTTIQSIEARNNVLSQDIFVYQSRILRDQKKNSEAIAALLRGATFYPYSSWIKNELTYDYARLGQFDSAKLFLDEVLATQYPSEWTAVNYLNMIDSLHMRDSIVRKAEFIRANFWLENVDTHFANGLKSFEEKMAFWNKMAVEHKNYLFPVENMIYLWNGREMFDKSDSLIRSVEAYALDSADADYKSDFLFWRAVNTVDILRHKRVSESRLKESMDYFDRYLKDNGRDAAYWEYMSELYLAANDEKKSAECVGKALVFRPDDGNLVWKLNTDLLSAYEPKRAALKVWEYISRQPYDELRIKSGSEIYSMWNVSPILALYYSNRYKELGYYKESRQIDYDFGTAYSNLSNSVKEFEYSYKGATRIGESFRYIGWYQNCRERLYNGSTEVVYNYPGDSVIIRYKNGSELIRRDDLRTGAVKSLRMGSCFINYVYDSAGNLTRIENSAGNYFDMTYDSASRIKTMSDSKHRFLEVGYDSAGQIVKLRARNVGQVLIYRSNGGDIDSLVSFDVSGKRGGRSITTSIQDLLTGFTTQTEKAQSVSDAGSFTLGVEDKASERMESELQNSSTMAQYLSKSLELFSYYVANQKNDPAYIDRASEILCDLFDRRKRVINKDDIIKVIQRYYDLKRSTRISGLDSKDWGYLTEMREWLAKEDSREKAVSLYKLKIEKLQQLIEEDPLKLLSYYEWLPKSEININGYWKEYAFSDIVTEPDLKQNTKFNSLYYLPTGGIILGTTRGFYALRRGYWEHFAYNIESGSFVREMEAEKYDEYSDVYKVCEFLDSLVSFGTGKGLIIAGKGFEGKPMKILGELELGFSKVSHLANFRNRLLVGSQNVLVAIDSAFGVARINFPGSNIYFIRAIGESCYVSTDKGLFEYQENGKFVQRTNEVIDDFVEMGDEKFYKVGANLKTNYDLKGRADSLILLPGQERIVNTAAKQIYGLEALPISRSEEALAVLTDLGIDFYHENHFEHFYLPFGEERKQQARGVATDGFSFAVNTGDAVLTFTRNNIFRETGLKALLTSADKKRVYAGFGSWLGYFNYNDASHSSHTIAEIQCDHLAFAGDSGLIANDGLDIYLFDSLENRRKLFSCEQFTLPNSGYFERQKPISSLLFSAGKIWVTAGASLFMYDMASQQTVEFNYAKDRDAFDSRSYSIENVFETADSNIYVVCSDEGHLKYMGLQLYGGLMKYEPQTGKMLRMRVRENYSELGFNWFVTGYTKLGDHTGMVATNSGFAEDNYGTIKDYWPGGGGLANQTYTELRSGHPSLFLGTRGARLGSAWVFGSAEGIVGYYNGIWFYPKRLNELLPRDLEFANYGGRKINCLETDLSGNLYVSTDLGFTILDNNNGDVSNMLFDNERNVHSLVDYENQQILEKEKEMLLNTVGQHSDLKKLLTDIDESKKRINYFSYVDGSDQRFLMYNSSQRMNKDSIGQLISEERKRYSAFMLKLQQQDPAIYQALDVKPLGLINGSFQRKMAADQCYVQYIPFQNTLYIIVVSKNQIISKEVNIDRSVLMDSCSFVSHFLAGKARGAGSASAANSGAPNIDGRLAFLYNVLLRPIKSNIADFKYVYIIPTNSLNNVPFGALLDNGNPQQPKYAIQETNIAYVNSLYFQELLQRNATVGDKMALFSNPDGSLPGATDEVNKIQAIFPNSRVFNKEAASTANFVSSFASSNMMHLATHGYLENNDLSKSWLQLSNSKFSMADIYSLPPTDMNTLVLSACQTGLNCDGMELATLSTAFLNRGVTSVISSLWNIDDRATDVLMEKFYRHLQTSKDKIVSLCEAQREMIKEGKYSDPTYWSAIIFMGVN